jgi:hypothetical protein
LAADPALIEIERQSVAKPVADETTDLARQERGGDPFQVERSDRRGEQR